MKNTSNAHNVPEPEFPFRHNLPIQIRFNDMDMLGHVNNTTYFKFFDLAKCRYFEELVKPEPLDWKKINVVVANINCDFYAPTFFNESIAVCTAVTKIGDKSLRMEQRVYETETGQVKALCHTILVRYDIEKGCSMAITDEWRESIEKFEGHPV